MKSWIAVFQVGGSQQVFRVNKTRIVIGSVVSADVRITGKGVAPIHAVVEMGTSPTIYDLASDTGIEVNGKKTVTQGLKSGDKITIGPVEIKFSVEDAEKAIPSPKMRESGGGQKLFISPSEDMAPLILENEREVEEIFDYRPASKQALEIVMSWNDTILDIEHFVSSKNVTIGAVKESDFGVPALLSAKQYPLAILEGSHYVLNLDSKMTGIVQKNGELRTLRDAGSSQRIALGSEDFAKISVGSVDFYLSYTAAPPRLKRQRLFERDPFFFKVMATSLLFTLAVIFTITNLKLPQNIEAEEVPERIATILYQPEKFDKPKVVVKSAPVEKAQVEEQKTKPKPPKVVKLEIKPTKQDLNKPIPKEMNYAQQKPQASHPKAQQAQAEGQEGKGAKAKGVSGTRGSAKAAPGKDQQTAAKRPSPEAGKGRGGGNSQVKDEGNLDFMKGAGEKIQNILGNSGQRLGKAGSDLQGFGGFDTQGKGGLALSGSGRGGGGTASSLGGLSDSGRGGGRVGTGLGAAGSGSSIVGGQSRVILRTGGPEETVIMGSIDSGAIERAILAHRDEFKLCYEREINAGTPKLAGRVTSSFVIGSSGRVTQAGVASSSLKNTTAERCIVDVIRRIEFPIPSGGGIVQVTYPFKFSPVGS